MRPVSPGSPSRERSIVVVDDDPALGALLTAAFEGAGFEVTLLRSGEETLARLQEPPGAVVLDVQLPGLSGYEICRELRARFGEELPIVFLSGERVAPLDRAAGLLLGADDYVVKPFEPDELLARVRRLLRPAAQRPVNGHTATEEPLTAREHEVLELLTEGRTQAEIAAQLVISPKTVGTHIQHILGKLGVHSRAQAVAAAYRSGLLDADDDVVAHGGPLVAQLNR